MKFLFLETEDRHDGKFKKILDVSKIKKTMTSKFILRLFFNGNERGKTLSRPARPASPPPFSSGTTCEARDEEKIIQCGSFFDSIFSSSASLVFFLLPFPIVFRSRNFFFLFLSLLMSAYLGLNMSETRLNLLFLMVLLSRSETD